MKKLHFIYSMTLAFDNPVRQHRFTLKCVPLSSERQQILDLSTNVYPNEFLSSDRDSFGNHCIYGYAQGLYDHFSVTVTGTALTGLSSFETARQVYQLGLFRYQTDMTRPGPCIRAFHDRFSFSEETTALDRALTYMRTLYGCGYAYHQRLWRTVNRRYFPSHEGTWNLDRSRRGSQDPRDLREL